MSVSFGLQMCAPEKKVKKQNKTKHLAVAAA